MSDPTRNVVIIGGGPAGLTAASELLERTDRHPIVLEASGELGGISRTVHYKGNHIDIGGHRFFSKSDRVTAWWSNLMPTQPSDERQRTDAGSLRRRPAELARGTQSDPSEDVMLVVPRRSRILFGGHFYDYPLRPGWRTFRNLGPRRIVRVGLSYVQGLAHPIRQPANLEEFFVSRFGHELYATFFQSYTEKVWGVPCREISAEWGAQRVKGLSVGKAVQQAVRRLSRARRDVRQKETETSLIERFLYPKYGPGQLWERCAERVRRMGGEIRLNTRVDGLVVEGDRVTKVIATEADGARTELAADVVFSTMPVCELVAGLRTEVPEHVSRIARQLPYRDFLIVGLLVRRMKGEWNGRGFPADTWIYVQEPGVHLGRVLIFNNWSPHMVADPDTVWLGLEYFCSESDEIWSSDDGHLAELAARELAEIGLLDPANVLDATVVRQPRAYPGYFGSYAEFPRLRAWLDRFENLYLLGRNGMHRYNNQDHSMLVSMQAVDNLIAGRRDKSNLWDLNTEQEYIETVSTR